MEFSVYLNEVEEVLRPDIYGLMERFLDQKFEQGQLQTYEMIKLTGQSCKSKAVYGSTQRVCSRKTDPEHEAGARRDGA